LLQLISLEDELNDFQSDPKTLYAVIRCIEVIGEAVKRLPDNLRDKYPDIPWKAIAGMRDRLIHGYDVVDNEIVWNTIICLAMVGPYLIHHPGTGNMDFRFIIYFKIVFSFEKRA